MDNVGDGLIVENANWKFSGEVAAKFDEHVNKSVPFYIEGQQLITHLSDFFIGDDSVCYDLGASTGALTLQLAEHNLPKSGAKFYGIDCEPEMIDIALSKKSNMKLNNVDFIVDNVNEFHFEPCDLFVAYYTVQFIRPKIRQQLIQKIYESLNWGGAFIMFEKVRAKDARFQDITSALYTEFKLSNGYTADEVIGKARSLKGILEPFSTQGNMDMLKRAGFSDVISIMKYVNFEGFLAIK